MTFVFAVFLPLLVVAVGILRVATSNGDNLAKILGWALVFLGGAKPQFTDEVAGAVAGMVVGRDRMEGV